MLSHFDYESLITDLKWLKVNHPERKTLISFVDRFQSFVVEEHQKMVAEVKTLVSNESKEPV